MSKTPILSPSSPVLIYASAFHCCRLTDTAMAFALHSQPRIHEPSRSCAPKFYSGLKLQSPCTLGVAKPSSSAELFNRVHQSLQSRSKNRGHGQITMMPIGVPRVPYRNVREGTWQWLDLYNALYRERVIFIAQYLDEEYSNQILATMLYLDLVNDTERIYFYLNGQGGDLTPSLSIYDTMKSLRSPVGTHNMSHAFNLGAFLLSAGEKGYRSGMPLSRVTLRPPEGTVRGQADDVRNEAAELLRIRDYLFHELAKNTGQSSETIFKDLARRKRLTAQQSVEYGIIDKIVRPARIKPNANGQDGNGNVGLG